MAPITTYAAALRNNQNTTCLLLKFNGFCPYGAACKHAASHAALLAEMTAPVPEEPDEWASIEADLNRALEDLRAQALAPFPDTPAPEPDEWASIEADLNRALEDLHEWAVKTPRKNTATGPRMQRCDPVCRHLRCM